MDDFNKLLQKFSKTNDLLIEELSDSDPSRASTKLLQEIKDNNKDNIFRYAEIQIGIGKYLDFMLPNETFKDHLSQLNNIASLAYQILQIHINKCRQKHEDGACMIGHVNYSRINSDLFCHSWPSLPLVHALCFSGNINPTTLSKNKTIYRIIGKDKYNKPNSVCGNWWLVVKPTDRRGWRSNTAVSEQWNSGDESLEYTLDNDLNVWSGTSAIQAVPNSNTHCYLKGGGMQIWLKPEDIEESAIIKTLWP